MAGTPTAAKRSGSPPVFVLSVQGWTKDKEPHPNPIFQYIEMPFTLADAAAKIAEAAFAIADELCYKNGVLFDKKEE